MDFLKFSIAGSYWSCGGKDRFTVYEPSVGLFIKHNQITSPARLHI